MPAIRQTRANLAKRSESHYFQKWPLASVSESGESVRNCLGNVGESGESQHFPIFGHFVLAKFAKFAKMMPK